jgi:hypothetical protein
MNDFAIKKCVLLCSVESSDIIVAVGAWKLHSSDQPKPTQMVQVAAIVRHPSFDAGSFFNDLALLILGRELKFDYYLDKICLPSPGVDVTKIQNPCIATGWDKKALQGMVQRLDPKLVKKNNKDEIEINMWICNYIRQFVQQQYF